VILTLFEGCKQLSSIYEGRILFVNVKYDDNQQFSSGLVHYFSDFFVCFYDFFSFSNFGHFWATFYSPEALEVPRLLGYGPKFILTAAEMLVHLKKLPKTLFFCIDSFS